MVAPMVIGVGMQLAKLAAPWLVGKIAGDKAADRAGEVVSLASALVGGGSPEEILAKVSGNKKTQEVLQAAMIDADLEWARLDAADRDSARGQQIELAKSGHAAGYAPIVVSGLVVAGFIGILFMIFLRTIPEGSQELAYILFGAMAAAFGQVTNFWLGSSHGSKLKTAVMSKGE